MKSKTGTRSRGAIFASTVLFVACAAPVAVLAQHLPLVGTLGSRGRELPPNTPVVVVNVPRTNHFVLLGVCAGAGGVVLTGNTIGFIALRPSQVGTANPPPPPCISFEPGFPLPAGEKLSCMSASTTLGSSCSVRWVISKE